MRGVLYKVTIHGMCLKTKQNQDYFFDNKYLECCSSLNGFNEINFSCKKCMLFILQIQSKKSITVNGCLFFYIKYNILSS